jgi:predicted SAM-dependent methyltransferase
MQPHIKIDLEQWLNSGDPLVIELVCGPKKKSGQIAIDKKDLPHVVIVADTEEGLPFLPDRSVDEIHCRSALEHIRISD